MSRPSSVPAATGPGPGIAGHQTDGTRTLLGDPRKAVLRLSLPMIVAMSVQTIYSFVDALWVSGLGADALAAVGFFFPFHIMLMSFAAGIGIGGASAVSRRLGAGDRKGASSVGTHTIILMLIVSVVLGIPLFLMAETLFVMMGARQVAPVAAAYGRVLFGGTAIVFFFQVANALLRGEGDARRSMYAIVGGAVLNIILDPIFIYVLGLGVPGAAWATLVSMGASGVPLFYWLFIKRDTYLSMRFRGFRFDRAILRDILGVGLPSTLQQLSMSISMFAMNILVVRIGGTDGVAIFTSGWRVAMLAILPLLGMASAITAVTGAAYGSGDHEKLDIAHMYGVKLGFGIEAVIALAVYILSPALAILFTTAGSAAHLRDGIVDMLRIIWFFFPLIAPGMLSSSMFQGVGRGVDSMILTVLRSIVFSITIAYILAVVMDMGLTGIWFGYTLGNVLGSLIAFGWARYYIGRLRSPG